MYFADVISIRLKISLFGNALCDAFIPPPPPAVCLFAGRWVLADGLKD